MKFRDRIIGTVRVRGDRLLPHPKNWRMHPENQKDALRGILSDLGVARSLTGVPADPKALAEVRALTTAAERRAWAEKFERGAGDILLLDGHLRAEEIRDQPLPVELLDLDEREQAELLATFDPIGDLATMDRGKFLDLAGDFNSTNAAVQALVADLAKVDAGGAPDFGLEGDGATGGGEDGSGVSGGAPAGEDEEEPVIPTDALIAKWNTAPGQWWVVPSITVPGREHRLLCGDCRDTANVERLHEGKRPDLGLHDPPYGINAVHTNSRGKPGGVSNPKSKAAPRRTAFAPIVDDDKLFDPAHLLGSAKVDALWGANCYPARLPARAEWVVWLKIRDEARENDFSAAELAYVSPPSGRIGHVRRVVCTSSKGGTLDGEQRLHPTQKPVIVQRQMVEWYSDPGDLVADWYMGAGAVIIACEQTGRIGHGMDIAHAYLAATLERLSQRGLTPRLVT